MYTFSDVIFLNRLDINLNIVFLDLVWQSIINIHVLIKLKQLSFTIMLWKRENKDIIGLEFELLDANEKKAGRYDQDTVFMALHVITRIARLNYSHPFSLKVNFTSLGLFSFSELHIYSFFIIQSCDISKWYWDFKISNR